MKPVSALLGCVAALFLSPTTSFADFTLPEVIEKAPTSPFWSDKSPGGLFTFHTFSPVLGQLQAVYLTLESTISGGYDVQNQGNVQANDVPISLSSIVSIFPGNSLNDIAPALLQVTPSATKLVNLPPNGSTTKVSLSNTATQSVILTSLIDTFPFTQSAFVFLNVSAFDTTSRPTLPITGTYTNLTSAKVTVQYQYVAYVPEPSSVVLFGLGAMIVFAKYLRVRL